MTRPQYTHSSIATITDGQSMIVILANHDKMSGHRWRSVSIRLTLRHPVEA